MCFDIECGIMSLAPAGVGTEKWTRKTQGGSDGSKASARRNTNRRRGFTEFDNG